MKYNLDNVCTGDRKADSVNSLIMVMASDIAEELALKDWGETRDKFWMKDNLGLKMCEEAQDIFNEYYDEYTDMLYKLVNNCIKIDNPKYPPPNTPPNNK